MKAELVKRKDRWDLYAEDGSKIASTAPNPMNKLSLKNCQAIKNGYDLDELAKGYAKKADEISKSYGVNRFQGDNNATPFKDGFKKALEILGDKKFSEEDFYKVFLINSAGNNTTLRNFFEQTVLPMFQQTEWDVEIEMTCPHPEDTYTCGLQYGCDEDGCNHPNQVPYLDKDGCLILKRI